MSQWSPNMSVHIPEIDSQHQELFEQVAALQAAMRGGNTEIEVRRILDFLGQYVARHFGTEETLMEKYEYPGRKMHVLQHNSFVSEFMLLKRTCDQGAISPRFVLAVHDHLTKWLINHIARTDKLLAAHVLAAQQAAGV